MNRIKILPILLLLNAACFGQKKYVVELKIENSNGKKVYFTDSWGGTDRTKAVHIDSGYFRNNQCVFKGTFGEMMYYSVAIDSLSNFVPFVIDTGKTVISGSADKYLWKSAVVSNSPQNIWADQAKKPVDSIMRIRERLQDSLVKYELANDKSGRKFTAKINQTDVDLGKFLLSYTQSHPNCYYAFYQLKKYYALSPGITALAKEIYPLFSAAIKNADEGQYLYSLLFKNASEWFVGKALPKITSYNTAKVAESIELSHNSVYLIDYWASWCGPCIATLPALKELGKRFQPKGFRIISISLDNNYVTWLKAIKKNGITWNNYCNLEGFNSPDVKEFGIRSIPFTILVNRDGKVVKFNPTEKEIEAFLAGI